MTPPSPESELPQKISIQELNHIFSELTQRIILKQDDFKAIHAVENEPDTYGCFVQTGACEAIIKNPPDEAEYSEFTLLLQLNSKEALIPINIVVAPAANAIEITCDEGETVQFSVTENFLKITYFQGDELVTQNINTNAAAAELEFPIDVVREIRFVGTALDLFDTAVGEPSAFARVRTLSAVEYKNIEPINYEAEEIVGGDVLEVFERLFAPQSKNFLREFFRIESQIPTDALARRVLTLRDTLTHNIRRIPNAGCSYIFDTMPGTIRGATIRVFDHSVSLPRSLDDSILLNLEYKDYYTLAPDSEDNKDASKSPFNVEPVKHLVFSWHSSGFVEITDTKSQLQIYYLPATGTISAVYKNYGVEERLVINKNDEHKKILLPAALLPALSVLAALQELPSVVEAVIKNSNNSRKTLSARDMEI